MVDTFQLLSQTVDNRGQATPTDGGAVFPPLIWNDDFSSGSLRAYTLTGTPIISGGRLTFGAGQDCRITLTDPAIINGTKLACIIAKCGVGIDNTQPTGNSRCDIWLNMNDVRFQITNTGTLQFANNDGSTFFPANAANSSHYDVRTVITFWLRFIVWGDSLQADLYSGNDPVSNINLVTIPDYHGSSVYSGNYPRSAAKRVITPQLRLNAAADGAPPPSNFWVYEWWVWSLDDLTFSR